VHALGDKYLRDVTELRAGQDWQRWMREAIEEADMFQLFWSHNSMRSVYVRQEWEYALSLGRPNFIRPTYWEMPLPESSAENLPPAELRQLHFQHLRANSGTGRTTATTTVTSQPPTRGQFPTERGGRGGASGYTPPGETVMCATCGTRNAADMAFCPNCGTLSVAALSYGGTVATSTQALEGEPDVFWEKRLRETGIGQSLPPPPPTGSQMKPYSFGKERTLLRPGFLLFFFLLIVIAVGIYLLVSFL
jgi:hypothetical protein